MRVEVCKHGHHLTPDNIYWEVRKRNGNSSTYRRCRTCRKQQDIDSYHRRFPSVKPATEVLSIVDWKNENIVYCRRCKQDVLRMPADKCGWCDTKLPPVKEPYVGTETHGKAEAA